ncbi:MAG: heme-binding protein [Mycobacterium sp.]|nr:heme-binding protein [Mycobacterium sp.]
MIISRENVRRGVLAILAAAVLIGVSMAIVMLPSAKADPDPCSAANLAETISKVNHNLSGYLAAHPDANQALGDAAKQSPFAASGAFDSYFDAHPEQASDVRDLQQPLKALSDQCGFQVTAGQVLVVLGDL